MSITLVSVCIAVRNQSRLIERSLESILQQELPPNHELEIIVTDDGSTDDTSSVLDSYPVKKFYLENDEYHNGVFAKNSSLRNAHGDIIIQQSADVIHSTPNVIKSLITNLRPGAMTFATVYNYHAETGKHDSFQYTGPTNRRPFFFLGACYREDVCKIGGYDPDFGHVIWYDDNWHADCLANTCKLVPVFLNVVGWHQNHSRPAYNTTDAEKIYKRKKAEGLADNSKYISSAGPWKYISGVSVVEAEGC